jgi:hypothetical protein
MTADAAITLFRDSSERTLPMLAIEQMAFLYLHRVQSLSTMKGFMGDFATDPLEGEK